MKQTLLLVIGAALHFGVLGQTLQSYVTKAQEAQKAGDYPTFYSMIMEARKLHPYHQGLLYQAGIASALTNKPEEAIQYLTSAIQIKSNFDLTIPELNSISSSETFKKLLALQVDLQTPIINSDTAFIVRDKTLHV
jgi:hypothetical protein